MDVRLQDATATASLRELAAALVGLSFLWAIFRGNFFGELVMYDMDNLNAEAFYYALFLAATAVVPLLLISNKPLKLVHELGETRWFAVAMALLTGAGCLLITLCSQDGVLFPFLLPLGGLFIGLGLFGTLPIWAGYLAGKPQLGIFSLLLSSMATSCIVSLLFSFAQQLGIARPMPLFALVPGLAYALLPQGMKRYELRPDEAQRDFRIAASHPQGAVIALTLFLIIGAMAKGCEFHQGTLGFDTIFTVVVTFFILLFVVVTAAAMHRYKDVYLMVGFLWIALVAVYIVGLLLIISSFDLPFVDCFIMAARKGLLFFLVLLLVLFARIHPDHRRSAFAIFIVSQLASAAISYCIVPALLDKTILQPHDVAIFALCLMLIPIVYIIAMLVRRNSEHEQHESPSHEDDLELCCARIQAECKLSPKEAEVLALLCKYGDNRKTVELIAEELCVTTGTVRTYEKRLRDKTNEHSRSELIALVHQKAQENLPQ